MTRRSHFNLQVRRRSPAELARGRREALEAAKIFGRLRLDGEASEVVGYGVVASVGKVDADKVEEELTAGLGEGQMAEFVEDDEVEARELQGQPTLASAAGFGFESIDQIHHVVETTSSTSADAAASDGNG